MELSVVLVLYHMEQEKTVVFRQIVICIVGGKPIEACGNSANICSDRCFGIALILTPARFTRFTLF